MAAVRTGDSLTTFVDQLDTSLPGSLVLRVAEACMDIQVLIQRGALSENVLGSAHSDNVQGEVQQNLDLLSNDAMLTRCQDDPTLAGMCSEESEDIYVASSSGRYLLLFDPLDGSSNIDVNVSIGTIFSILPRASNDDDDDHPSKSVVEAADFCQRGDRQLAAGYVIYGPQTTLVLTVGHGVHMFTLDVSRRVFVCTQPRVTLSPSTQEFAINMSNTRHWEPAVAAYVADCLAGTQGPRGKNFNMRWIASMVAEVHRILCRGGVFLYPWDVRMKGKMEGRLRLLYEANPMSFLLEQAGGAASTGIKRMLDVVPTALHQRVPVVLGCRDEVQVIVQYHRDVSDAQP
ncbi:hypothetical protein H257_16819 [Aphanomyces astaci]|uniref:fructose-bisphosphatase n=2 Tax=Aphanomyces astaci TaxID=112090 RepID=W4FHF3_APHAT|nr:hypothetical protein H257_16819 [Aphanomyces astaci]ETV66890.1 hypothetical protein H257_16819 [Aphanomyces astaci]RQM25517.1 hypothetical protein B5M09_007310 [Aphanomyces astaci]|eukprot:XP_009843693.1 hypothetical protein H257_16819 [Aphanomyces astaci]